MSSTSMNRTFGASPVICWNASESRRRSVDTSQYPRINQTLRRIKPKHAEDEKFFRELYAATLALHPKLEFIIDIVDADDGRLFPNMPSDGSMRIVQ